MRRFNWKAFYWRLSAGLAGTLLLGWLIGQMLPVLLIATVAYLLWHLHNLHKLALWLESPTGRPPESLGLWSSLFDHIDRMQKTRRKQRRELKALVNEFQRATNAFPDATLVIDEDDAILWFNLAAADLLGLRISDDLGSPVTNLLRDPSFINWLAVHALVNSDLHLRAPNAPERLLSVRAVQYRKNQRLLIFRDITEISRVEKIRRDFVSNVSHELRTPLTVLTGYLEMFQDQCEPEQQQAVRQMHIKCREMHRLLEDLIDLSRLQDGSTQREDSELHMASMLMQLKEQAEELSGGKHRLNFRIDDQLGFLGHGPDLESAFRNLLFNAIKYSPNGGDIDVCWELIDHQPVFSVSDSGLGIPEKDLPRITERFYRVGSDRARSTGGTGLGLSIVKHVLKAHGGQLLIESELGEGSTFRCVFSEKRVCQMPQSSKSGSPATSDVTIP